MQIKSDRIVFPDNTEQFTAGGGGDYTPEALVWVNKTSERAVNTEYTNTNNVPLYVQLSVNSPSTNDDVTFYIDGNFIGRMGKGGGDNDIHLTSLFVVPAGSTYELKTQLNGNMKEWHEARMPLAVGSGGSVETVDAPAFSVNVDSNSFTVPATSWTEVSLNDVKFDTHNTFNTTNNRFTPTVAGYYQVTGYGYFVDAVNSCMVSISKNGYEYLVCR